MVTLGINAAYHDSSACLVQDGIVVAAAEEERFTQIKHGKRPIPFAAYELPHAAIDFCLATAGIELADVDHVAYSYDPALLPGAGADRIVPPLEPSAAPRALGAANPWEPLFLSYVVNAPRQLVSGAPHHLDARFRRAREAGARYRWHFVDHHLCHQASAFLAGPPGDAAVLTLDGRGECASTQYGVVRANRYQRIGEVRLPHSLGLMYEQVTRHLGFLHSSDEYKVMALASFGTDALVPAMRARVHWVGEGLYRIDPLELGALCPPRLRGGEMLQSHLDLARAAQKVLEETALEIARWLHRRTGAPRLLMAGGVALNCVMNAALRDAGVFDEVWVQPAAGDAGTSLGAALWIDHRVRAGFAPGRVNGSDLPLADRAYVMNDVYLGPGFDETAIERALRDARAVYRRPASIAHAVADRLAADRIVGWFQGRMEFGPRALGARSILASPISPAMQARLNELKDREDFRPVAPVVTEEAAGDWFEGCRRSPFMLFVHPVRAGRRERIPSACHADGTARVQTVNAQQNGAYHAVLQAFARRTGVPVLVNTSFNTRGKPIVCTPRDALECFYTTPLDVLAIGPFLLEKPVAAA
jgi:carbamoyltransferase